MAPFYDAFTAHHDYEGWVADLLRLLGRHGLEGRRLLDVGCGTGKSFLPLLDRGWQVTACDISPAMLAIAREKTGARADLMVADIRELPKCGEFDLVWALDDVMNYLLSVEEMEHALLGMSANLTSTGLLLFDLNELLVYRTFFAETQAFERGDWRFVYEGHASKAVAPGSICSSTLVAARTRSDLPAVTAEVEHRQKHFSEAEVLAAMIRTGLDCLAVYGHGFDGVPRQPLDTSTHTKAIYLGRLAA